MKDYFGYTIRKGDVCMVVKRKYGHCFRRFSLVEIVGLGSVRDFRCEGKNRKELRPPEIGYWYVRGKKLVRIGRL